MKKINRLLKNYDFKKVLDKKNSIANKEFVIYINKNNLNHIRVGISVSSKIGNSVIRHKIKRQINEMLRELIDLNKNNDIVIIVRNKYIENDFNYNKESLYKLISKIQRGEQK